ncbi:UNVERIFIED_CONTAM: hypothetical protein PYX00_004971 [Menopon gallinae]
MTLIKNLDEALCHGLKQLHLGFWKAIQSILHPEFLTEIDSLPKYNGLDCTHLNRGRTWIPLALREECFINYVHCMIRESQVNKFYESWSIVRNNDRCNKFLSILSGLDNILFSFQVDFINKPPSYCNFSAKVIKEDDVKLKFKNLSTSKSSITASSSSLISPVDSGVHIHDSSSDMEQLSEDKTIDIDFLNGNIPETVMRRKNKKDTKRHVSFHEDIIYKSPDKCRKLKWDCENLRYSWSGEDLDSSIIVDTDFSEIKSQMECSKMLDINERGAPEGEETPCNLENLKRIGKTQKSVIVKRFLQSINKQSKIKQLSKKYNHVATPYQFCKINIDKDLVSEVNKEIESECENHWKSDASTYEVSLNLNMISQMIRHECIYKAYQLRDYLFIITDSNIYLINKLLEMKKIMLENVKYVVICPDSHIFWLWELKKRFHKFVTADEELTHEIMGRLELCMRRNHFELPEFRILSHNELRYLKRQLVSRCVIEQSENFVYCGVIYLEKEMEAIELCSASSKRGFLMYRDQRLSDSWEPGDFLLKGNILYLFKDGLKNPKFAINLSNSCRSCSRTVDTGRPHTFQITIDDDDEDSQGKSSCFYEEKSIKSKLLKPETQKLLSEIRQKVSHLLTFGSSFDEGCVLEFAAANECELNEWLQLIVQASCGDCGEDASRDDIIEGTLLLTENSLIITNELFSDKDIEILSCAQISDIASIRIGKDTKDLFTLIEFSCMEATSTSGDWIIFMSSRNEVEKLDDRIRRLWCLNAKYPGGYLTEERLIKKCRKTQSTLRNKYWTNLLE